MAMQAIKVQHVSMTHMLILTSAAVWPIFKCAILDSGMVKLPFEPELGVESLLLTHTSTRHRNYQ